MQTVADAVGKAVADLIRFPGEVIERWFAGYLLGMGVLFLSSPGMFELLPNAYAGLASGAIHSEAHYGWLLTCLGLVQMVATFGESLTAKRVRVVAIVLGAAVLIGFGEMFRATGANSGAFNYWFLGVCNVSQLVRVGVLLFARTHGVAIDRQVSTTARIVSPHPSR